MGIKDTATIRYMRRSDVFADAFNYYFFDGRPAIRLGSLSELDTRETLLLPYGGTSGAPLPVQRERDVLKSLAAMTDRHAAYLLLGVEAQSHIHYAMPVKALVYDALQYARQVEQAAASHRQSGDYRGQGGDAFLSGFFREDRLLPVVTLAIYFGPEPWDGPLSLSDMFRAAGQEPGQGSGQGVRQRAGQGQVPKRETEQRAGQGQVPKRETEQDSGQYHSTAMPGSRGSAGSDCHTGSDILAPDIAALTGYAQDYRIHLLTPEAIGDKDFTKFHSSLKEVLAFIKHSGDMARLDALLRSDDGFRRLGRSEVDVLNACVHACLPTPDGKEAIDVCEAIRQMRALAEQKGLEMGRRDKAKAVAKARQEGEKDKAKAIARAQELARQEGEKDKAKAIAKTKTDTLTETIRNLTLKAGWSPEQAMDMMGLSEDDRQLVRQQMRG